MLFAADSLASRPFAATFEPFARLAQTKGVADMAIRSPGDGSVIASARGQAMVVVRAAGPATRVASSTGATRLQIEGQSDGTRVATGVGRSTMRGAAKGWAAKVNFPSYPPESGHLVRIGRRFYRWEPTLGRWRPAPPA